jgi:hypothetical protein
MQRPRGRPSGTHAHLLGPTCTGGDVRAHTCHEWIRPHTRRQPCFKGTRVWVWWVACDATVDAWCSRWCAHGHYQQLLFCIFLPHASS